MLPTNDNANIVIQVGETRETGEVRIHRGASSLRLTNIRNAGKRGKRCSEAVLFCDDDAFPWESVALEAYGRAKRGDDWATVVQALVDVARDGAELTESVRRGVDVEPSHLPVEVDGAHVRVSAAPLAFVARGSDVNETTALANRAALPAMTLPRGGGRREGDRRPAAHLLRDGLRGVERWRRDSLC